MSWERACRIGVALALGGFWRHTVGRALTCDEAGDDERKHEHLQHPHEQLTREREVLDLAVGELVRTQGKCQADT